MATNSIVESLIGDLLEWIGPGARPYAEVQEAWRTSCPRLPVWEDARDAKYLDSWRDANGVRLVAVSPMGKSFLAHRREVGQDSA
jgi:D-3-phosphoglycerate dehydrogenase / 2-oxoglutarate reductase